MGDAHFIAVIKVLTSSGVAPSTLDTLHKLKAKHPYAPPLTLSSSPLGVDTLSIHKDLVLNRISRFSKGTSCGRDGFIAQHLMDILGGVASAVADTEVVNLFLSGKCPSQLGEYIASAPLTLLVKPGGGIRPIAVGTDFQFGIGVPGGCEAVLHFVNRLIESKGNDVGLSMLLVDFNNSFNLVDKSVLLEETRVRCPSISPWVEFCYARPAMLYYDDSVLWSCQWVQQGDPLGPLLFALALHPLVQTINQSCELTLQAWYLDDGTIVGDTLMVAKALDIIKIDGPARGLFLNVDKTELFWPVEDPRSRDEGVFPINISRPLTGVKLLGGSVNLDEEAQDRFDEALRASLEKIVTASGSGFGDWQWRLATLPIKLGGLGIFLAGDIIQYTFLSSRLQTSALQSKILLKTSIVSQGSSFKHALDAFNTTCNVDVLSVTTCTSAPQMLKTLAKCYFGVLRKSLFPKDEPSSIPALFCAIGFQYLCSLKVGIMVRKEASMCFLSEDGKDLRPVDLLLLNWLQDENPIRTLGDYSKPSHEGYKNTIELLEGNNM
nr:hypothetical protein [Tanacetum cinerariifolium]